MAGLPKLPELKESSEVQSKETPSTNPAMGMVAIPFDLMEKAKDFAFWERITLREFFTKLLEDFFEGKDIQPRLQKSKRGRKPSVSK